jgi:hypothetical protein
MKPVKKKKRVQQDLPFLMKKKTHQKLLFVDMVSTSSKMPKIPMMLWIRTLTLKFNSARFRRHKKTKVNSILSGTRQGS